MYIMGKKMKYTVCYAIYCSRNVEAENEDEAIEMVIENASAPEDMDDMEVTLVVDENGNQIIY